METTRQKKVSKLLQKDIAEILNNMLKRQGNYGVILSITRVTVTVDFSVAKIFLSVFPSEMSEQVMSEVYKMSSRIRHGVAQKAKKQLRKIPELLFFLDDSLDYIEKIEDSLRGLDNPLKH